MLITPAVVSAQSPAFTYQGRLSDGRRAANGTYDLQFRLADAPGEGYYIGSTLTNNEVAVSNGLFSVTLDFGNGVFGGTPLWLEIGVRKKGA